MSAGWVRPLAATVRLHITDGGKHVEAGWEFDRVMVSNHAPFQVAGNPYEPRPPMKFHNYWTVRTPRAELPVHRAANRPSPVVQVLSGIVDTDAFPTPVNFPFIATADDGVHVLPKGTPLVQIIPFRRDDAGIIASVRAETAEDEIERLRTHRSTSSGGSWYRNKARAGR